MTFPTRQTRRNILDRQVARLNRKLQQYQQREDRLFWARLAVVLVGGPTAWLALAFSSPGLGRIAVLTVLAAFFFIIYLQRRLEQTMARFSELRRHTEEQLARQSLDWEKIPLHTLDDLVMQHEHPFEADLNLTGSRSLHQLLDEAASEGGSRCLRNWLLEPDPDIQTIHNRQGLVHELLTLTGYRRRLILLGSLLVRGDKSDSERRKRWEGERLMTWLNAHVQDHDLRRLLIILSFIAFSNLVLFALNLLGFLPALWLVTLALYAGLYLFFYRNVKAIAVEAADLAGSLDKFRQVLEFMEDYPYRPNSRLAECCSLLHEPGTRPSVYLRGVTRVASAASMQRNQFFWLLLNTLVPWDLYFGYRLEQYKQKIRRVLPLWLDLLYRLEALISIADFAYLNPEYKLPEVRSISALDREPLLVAQQLGHPLIPHEKRVRNDFILERKGEIVLVTGSNMAGKTTFLRTMGINLVLAYLGGPVDAQELRTVPLRVFTSMNISDSLSDGISYFYAEVRRLKKLLEAYRSENPTPIFFLIDEIFRGTNNLERQIGSRSFVRALAGGNGAGLISTHDLSLVTLEEDAPGVYNYHFREDVRDGKMIFDYRLRPGPSPTTNALKIMRIEGLPVPEESQDHP